MAHINDTFPRGSFETGRTAIILIKPDNEFKLNVRMGDVTNLEALDKLNMLTKELAKLVIEDAVAAGYPTTDAGLDAYMNKMRGL